MKYHARFTSYKEASHLKPQDISKIFRAVGPPGRYLNEVWSWINHIEFEHMKYGEDKLFFLSAIWKSGRYHNVHNTYVSRESLR